MAVRMLVIHVYPSAGDARHALLADRCDAAFYPTEDEKVRCGWFSRVKVKDAGTYMQLQNTFGKENFSQIANGFNSYDTRIRIDTRLLPATLPDAVDKRT